jgi:hypothetical protein
MLPTRVATAIKRGGDVDLNGLGYDKKREVSEIKKTSGKEKKRLEQSSTHWVNPKRCFPTLDQLPIRRKPNMRITTKKWDTKGKKSHGST